VIDELLYDRLRQSLDERTQGRVGREKVEAGERRRLIEHFVSISRHQ
jgi:hypothetical protein